jgi:hypothetical protein
MCVPRAFIPPFHKANKVFRINEVEKNGESRFAATTGISCQSWDSKPIASNESCSDYCLKLRKLPVVVEREEVRLSCS